MGDFERVKKAADLREYAEAHLTRAKSGGKYVCPVCKSGDSGEPGSDSAFSITADGNRWTCFGSCGGKGGDIFDLAGAVHNTTDRNEQLRYVADWAGVTLESDRGTSGGGFKSTWGARSESERATEAREEEKATDTPENDYTAGRERHRRYIAECAERMREEPTKEVISYLSARGITHADAVTLGIGYDPKPAHGWQDEAGAWHNTPRLVLPWLGSDYYHIDRAIDERARNLKYDKPSTEEVGAQPFYSPEAFTQGYVIAVEGVLDAIALQLSGFNAIALGGTAVNDFANEAAARNYGGVVIDMLDADGEEPRDGAKGTKGRGAGADLVTLLGKAGVTVLSRAEYGVPEGARYGQVGTVSDGYKDAGEWYAKEPQYLKDFMGYAVKAARDKAQRARDAEYREALRKLHVKDPASVARDVLELRDVYEPVPTGIKALDGTLGGGVSLGELTIFGATSSYGKTTLAVQIADYMASRGRSVLFTTIEQSAKELIAKSLSRIMYLKGSDYDGGHIIAPNEITSLKTRNEWSLFRNDRLGEAVETYSRTIAPNLRILEGNEQPTVNDVRAIAEKMAEHDGRAPIIFIDYLQLLAPLSDRYDTDKRNADANVSELRMMARDLKTHVWCISSLNRESYTNGVTMTAFKESGSLEFGSDNLMGLQMRGMAEKLKNASGSDAKVKREIAQLYQENKAKPERDCELVILKQRNGALPDAPLPITFKPMAACFQEPTSDGRAAHQAQARTIL